MDGLRCALTGDDNENFLYGLAGDDIMTGAGAYDRFFLSGGGIDTLRFNAFGEGNDVVEDWDTSEDQLAFASALDIGKNGILDDLQAAVVSVTEVGDYVVVSFNTGFSLTFAELANSGVFNSIDDLFADTSQVVAFDDKTVLGGGGADSRGRQCR